MGKWKHKKVSKSVRHQPLGEQIEESTFVQPKAKRGKAKNEEKGRRGIDKKLGKKILAEAKKQREDIEKELDLDSQERLDESLACVGLSGIKIRDDDVNTEEPLDEGELEGQDALFKALKISEDDERNHNHSKKSDKVPRKSLNEFILDKLKEKDGDVQSEISEIASVKLQDLDEKIIELYKGVKTVLSRYRSGKIPKAFKVIPALSNWEQILALTDPDHWTSAAMLQATRLFTANLKERMAQRFFNLILLPRIRDEIAEYKRLNVHLYQALKKALFKPGAFYKGIVLPLCMDEDSTLREAVIISSVLNKSSVPILHSCAAMLKIAEMDYKGANSIFLLTLLKKKYALPYRVIDALVCHFARFTADKQEFPVLWYQALLAFVENYCTDISDEQKEVLSDLCKVHRHHLITPVIMNYLHTSNEMQE